MLSSKKKAVILSGLFILFTILIITSVCTGDDAAKKIATQRPLVTFDHATHLDREGDCLVCHHDYDPNDKGKEKENILDDGELSSADYEDSMTLDVNVEDEPSGFECATCHNDKSKTKMNSMDAFHLQCIGCHEKNTGAPVLCGECHKLEKP